MRQKVHLNLVLGGRGGLWRREVVVQDRERLLRLDARDRVAIVHVGVECGGHRVGVRRRRVLARAVRRRARAGNRPLRAGRRVTRVPCGHERCLVGGSDALSGRDRTRDARQLCARRGVGKRRDEGGRLGRGHGYFREHLAAVGVACEEDAVVVRRAWARLRTVATTVGARPPAVVTGFCFPCERLVLPEARNGCPVAAVRYGLARFAHAATRQLTKLRRRVVVPQLSARHRAREGSRRCGGLHLGVL